MDNSPSHRILNDIVNILKEKNLEFQLGNNSNDNLENLMNRLNIYIKNNLTVQSKKIEIDLSFLKGYENLFGKFPKITEKNSDDDNFFYYQTDDKLITEKKNSSKEILEDIKKLEERKNRFYNEENDFFDDKTNELSNEEKSLNDTLNNEILNDSNQIQKIFLHKVKQSLLNYKYIYINFQDEEKKVNMKEEEKEKQYLNYLFQKNKKPLSFFNLYESKFKLQSQNINKKKSDLFPLKTYLKKNKIKINLFSQIENSSLTNLILNKQEKEKINCFCLQNINQVNFLYGGSNKGFVYKYDINNNKEIGKFNTKEGDVLCIEVYEDFIVTGHQNGAIHILNKGNVIETIKDDNLSPIIAVKIVKINIPKNKFEIVYSNRDRQIKLIYKKKYLLVYKMKFDTILLTPSPVYNIINYNPISNLSISKKKKMKFCFVSIKNVTVMPISPIFTKQEEIEKYILTISRPENVNENEVPQCCFGYGYLPDNNNNNNNDLFYENFNINDNRVLLFFAWGKNIRIYKEEIENGIMKFKIHSVFINDLPIIKISYLSFSSVIIIDCNFNVKIILTYNFNVDIYTIKQSIINDKFFFNSFQLENISNKIFSYDNPDYNPGINSEPKKIQRTLFSTFIIDDLINHNLIIIGENKVSILQINSWKNIINDFLLKEEFENMFCCALTCFNSYILQTESDREHGFFTDFKEQYCYEILFKCLNQVKLKKEDEYWDLLLRNIFEFSLRANSYKSLYGFIEAFLKIFENKSIIYDVLTKFISENNKFNKHSFFEEVKENFVMNYIHYYSEQKKIIELSNNLLNFPIHILKYFGVSKIIKDKNLIEPYIYICMNITDEQKDKINNYDKEYFKPITYLFNLFSKSEEFSLYNDFIINQNININFSDICNCKGYYGHKCLWLINSIFNNKIYLKLEPIDSFSYNNLIKNISLLLFEKDTIKQFLHFDPYSYFQTIRRLFLENKLFSIINEPVIDDDFKSFSNLMNDTELLLSELTPKMYLEFVIESVEEEENNFFMKKDLFDLIGDFSKTMNNTFWLNKNILIEATIFLINYPKTFLNNKEKDKYNCHINDNFENQILKDENRIMNIIKISSTVNLLNEEDCEKLINILKESPYQKIQIFLYNISKKYKETLNLKLNSIDVDSDELFNWIDIILNELENNVKKFNRESDKSCYNDFKNEIMNKLKELVNISVTDFSKLVDKYFSNEQEQIFQKLDNNPSLQLSYIDKYLESNENKEKINYDNLKKCVQKKIFLLNDFRQYDKILELLTQYNFLYDNNFIIKMKEKNIIEAVIYINIIMGNYDEAMNLTIETLEQIRKETFKEFTETKFNNVYISELNQRNKILVKLGILICESIPSLGRAKSIDKNWENLLNELYDCKHKLNQLKYERDNKEVKHNLVKETKILIGNNIENVLISMTDYIELLPIIDLISKKFNKFGTREFIRLIIQIINSFEKYDVIYKSVKVIYKFTNYNEFVNLYSEKIKGISFIVDKCDLCNKFIQKDNFLILFKCGHKYHKKCCYNVKIFDDINSNKFIVEKTCIICKEDEIEIPLNYKEVLLKQDSDNMNIDYEEENNKKEKNEFIEYQKQYILNKKINNLRKVKKHQIDLMNLINLTDHYDFYKKRVNK